MLAAPAKIPSLRRKLFEEPYRFEFFQALRLLETLEEQLSSSSRSHDFAHLKSRVRLDFPASDIDSVSLDPKTKLPVVEANVLGLATVNGPLPHSLIEMVLERIVKKDYAGRDFLDIFNHRLLSIFYRIRKAHRVSLSAVSPQKTSFAQYLYATFGLGPESLKDRLDLPDRALLSYSGLLAKRPRSAAGLEVIVADYFGTKVSVTQLLGRWLDLEPAQQTQLGANGRNSVLGLNALIGKRVWDAQSAIEIQLGPLTLNRFASLLPQGQGFSRLRQLVKFYAGPGIQAKTRLVLSASEIPKAHIGQTILGRTSWLTTRAPVRNDSQACFHLT